MTPRAGGSTVTSLAEHHPEWKTWLALYEVARASVDEPGWAEAVPPHSPSSDTLPLVSGATFAVDAGRVARLLSDLLRQAGGPPVPEAVALPVLEAAVNEEASALPDVAAGAGVDAALLGAAAALATMPLLQACRQAWLARVPVAWMRGFCPVCGAWATLTEARGLERRLRLRCGRCGADWVAQVLRCPFCGTTDHDRLATLISDVTGDTRKVEACGACLGYVKTVTTLTPCPPVEIALLDLETVDLDLAAMSHGYARPSRPGHRLDARVVPRAPQGRFASMFRRR